MKSEIIINLIIPSSTWVRALVPAELRDHIRLCTSLEEELGFCFITAPLFDCLFSVLSSVPLKALIPGTCSRVSIVARLRSQNGLSQNELSYVKKAMPGSLSPRSPYPICFCYSAL
ncbi:unnamed protein product [Rangifer tarandus platyrhynchus]|uniref:Uncharacterized protein n=2 Tax=Rangifer tarandus platyrhynchus TaxID=3082113 RepID=A0AC59ZQ84_RANTA|nr:unnamed protein product [Rangifer tarandus platyrhynchus]